MEHDDFYLQLENRFRGSPEVVTARLQVYLPLVAYLRQAFDAELCSTDLGCGRGEWIELLSAQSVAASGVDLDPGMLQLCREKGLSVIDCDVVDHLRNSADESVHLLTAFHIVEHLEFNNLLALISEAFRCLKPGGLLIMETPNPENIIVGSCNFYIDPTHCNPIPPQLLAFAAEYCGFNPPTTIRLQEQKSYESSVSLADVFFGPSPDYAIVAMKPGTDRQTQLLTDRKFEYSGVSLARIAKKYDEEIDQRLSSIETAVTEEREYPGVLALQSHLSEVQLALTAESETTSKLRSDVGKRLSSVETSISSIPKDIGVAALRQHLSEIQSDLKVETRLASRLQSELAQATTQNKRVSRDFKRASNRLQTVDTKLALLTTELEGEKSKAKELQAEVADLQWHSHHWWQTAEAAQKETAALRSSWSWRLTTPMRKTLEGLHGLKRMLSRGIRVLISAFVKLVTLPLRWAMQWVLARPKAVDVLYPVVLRFPTLHAKLIAFAQSEEVLASPEPAPAPGAASEDTERASPEQAFTARSLNFYKRLKRR